jgi:hypothetical protein
MHKSKAELVQMCENLSDKTIIPRLIEQLGDTKKFFEGARRLNDLALARLIVAASSYTEAKR